ncbi:MAG: L-2-amino-thiazoline-4-carboxylic acid hydrolase, partial [Oscillospiraceae bacterium]|nr:L-2-amino-thiazoline-4-carboxylic acid hydrolase [Oscillospiraceae bacterium]
MEIMENGETAAAEKTVKLFQNVVKLPFGKGLFLKGFAAGCRSGFDSDVGFRHVIYRADYKRYQMDVTACPYVKYCNAEGVGELTRIFCDIDVYAYGHLNGITFERSQTLGTGW